MHKRYAIAFLAGAMPTLLAPGQAAAEEEIAKAYFACAANKSVTATFYPDSVALKLSDGRDLTLPQVISGSGARYANADESFVFWNKGDTAFVTEGANGEQTYADCVSVD